MVPYAGYDPDDTPFGKSAIRFVNYPTKRKHCLTMFRWGGKDTYEIAKTFGIHEKTVLRWITEERSERLGRQNPYGAKS
jgi:hypothetical protein